MSTRHHEVAPPPSESGNDVAVDSVHTTVDSAAVRHAASLIEDDLGIATRLHDLQTWISQAQCLLDRLRFAADNDAVLGQKLSQRGVMIYTASWDDAQADGLDTLNTEISFRLDRVARSMGLKHEGAAK